MTNSKDLQIITYSEDYLIACSIYRLLPEEVLANFVRLLSYDNYMLGSEDEPVDSPSRVVTAYLQPLTEPQLINKKYEDMHKKCKKTLESILDTPNITLAKKVKKLKLTAESFYHRISKKHLLINRVTLPDARQLILPNSFIVFCFVQGIDPVCLLQFFVDHVSCAKDFAFNDLKHSSNDPFIWFVGEMSNDYFKDRIELHEVGFYDQHKKMCDLEEALKEEADYEKRLAAFTECLKGMYQSFKEVPIEPCFLSELIE